MKLPLSLIKQFVDVRVSPYELAEKLTRAGVKVEDVEKVGEDFVFSFEITTNRGDLLGALGIAREISAIYGIPIRHPEKLTRRVRIQKPVGFSIGIQNPADCPRYLGALFAVKVSPSPDWLKRTLTLCGLRPVNNIVDITNYLMLKYGQPTHAFDADKITRSENLRLIVRRARKGEGIVALDHQKRNLDPNHLVIADEKGPIALAGVMGGEKTEVSPRTKAIILEVATFDPTMVRKAEIDFNLRTEASQRFEKGLDPYLPTLVFSEAQKLLEEYAQAELLASPIDKKRLPKPKTIKLNDSFVERILGVKISPRKITEILKGLGFEVKVAKSWVSGKIPTFRKDLAEEIDLVEEVARVYGYQNLPSTLPSGEYPDPTPLPTQKRYEALKEIKRILASLGLSEAYTLSLTKRQSHEAPGVLNPLSAENSFLRVSLLPGLRESCRSNLKNFPSVGLFEVGKVFPGKGRESLKIGGVFGGQNSYFTLKGILEEFLEKLGVGDLTSKPKEKNEAIVFVNSFLLGTIAEEEGMATFEIDYKTLASLLPKKRKFQPFSTFPKILEDISFILPENAPVGPILSRLKKISPWVNQIQVLDLYPIGGKEKSVTVQINFQAREKSLSSKEIKPVRAKIRNLLENRFGVKLR